MRPDQHHHPGQRGPAGSRSGAGDTAGALGYPGVPAAVPNCQGASLLQQNVSTPTVITFAQAGRLWFFDLSYTITSNNSFAISTVRTVATLSLSPSGLILATVQLGVADPNQADSGGKASVLPGLPLVGGESVILSVNGGNVITNLDQQASCSVLYSYP